MNKQKLIELRCKAWGITEDEYYCNQCSDFSPEDMARAYRRGKNKGARDKAIQNVGFYQKQMQDIYDKKNKQIADLEKENAELLEKLKNQKADYETYYKSCYNAQKKTEKQLTKAKEIIHKVCYEYGIYDKDLMEEAKQFLKECK